MVLALPAPVTLPLMVPPLTLSTSAWGDRLMVPAIVPAIWSIVTALAALTKIASAPPVIVPVLTMWLPAAKAALPLTMMPKRLPLIVPALLMPPAKVAMLATWTPVCAVIVPPPALVMPPRNVAVLTASTPWPLTEIV